MLTEIEKDGEYLSPSGLWFKVLHLGKHGQDCGFPMVVYTNLERTHDRPAGEIWTLSESLFLKQFSKPPEGVRFTKWRFTALGKGVVEWRGDLPMDQVPELARDHGFELTHYNRVRREGCLSWRNPTVCYFVEVPLNT